MAECVGRNGFSDFRFFHQIFKHNKNHHPGEPAAPAVQKKNIFLAWFNGDMYANIISIHLYIFYCRLSDRHQSFLVSLPDHSDEPHIKVKTGKPQINQFGNAQSATVQGFKYCLVSSAFGFAQVNLRNDLFNFFKAQCIGKALLSLGDSSKMVGSFLLIFSIRQKLKNERMPEIIRA